MASCQTVPPDKLSAFACDLLVASHAAPEEAIVVAETLVWADLRGRHPQGVFRVPVLAQMLERGIITSPSPMTWTEKAPATHHLDAGDGFGQVAGQLAMTRAVALAKDMGVGAVTVSRSNHYGAASYYGALAAEAGCVGLTCTNASPTVAPWGGTRAALGTNPIAFACPTSSGDPILVDLSTSAIAGSTVRALRESGGRLPEGVALDATGAPTTDPADVSAGCLLPAAGSKGFGLGLIVEILAAILTGSGLSHEVGSYYATGTRAAGLGHFFLAFDIRRFQPVDGFLERLDTLTHLVKATAPALPTSTVRMPGEIRARYARENMTAGINLPVESVRALEQLGQRLDVLPPWN